LDAPCSLFGYPLCLLGDFDGLFLDPAQRKAKQTRRIVKQGEEMAEQTRRGVEQEKRTTEQAPQMIDQTPGRCVHHGLT